MPRVRTTSKINLKFKPGIKEKTKQKTLMEWSMSMASSKPVQPRHISVMKNTVNFFNSFTTELTQVFKAH